MTFSSKMKQRDFNVLKTQTFDVVIIGGGISGVWLALHCRQLGYKTALIEQGDYASQTSSASSKLLHGGIRYLQQMQFGRVRESALERAHYIYAAPHLSVSVPFVVPTFRDFSRSKFFLNCGMLVYRALCLGENSIIESREQQLAPIKSISPQALSEISPISAATISATNGTGAVVFHERHMQDSERMVLGVAQTARKLGAAVFNYVRADSLIKEDNRIVGVNATDQIGDQTGQAQFEIKSNLVINATGPWIDELNSTLSGSGNNKPSITGFAVGSHIVCRQLSEHAIAITTKHQSDAKIDRGGRHVFIIPWRGHSLIGTSYDEVSCAKLNRDIQSSHVKQLLDAVNQALPEVKLNREDLISGYSGLYPLKTDNIQSEVYQGSGEYQIIDHAKADHIEGYVTALGAKFTTGRKLSSLTLKVIARKLNKELNKKLDSVSKLRLHNSQYTSLEVFKRTKLKQYQDRLPAKLILHLIDNYGSDLDEFIGGLNDELMQPICPQQPDIMGQVTWAIEKEQAFQLRDIFFGRTSLGLLGISNADIERVAQLMAKQLAWTDSYLSQQVSLMVAEQRNTRVNLDAFKVSSN